MKCTICSRAASRWLLMRRAEADLLGLGEVLDEKLRPICKECEVRIVGFLDRVKELEKTRSTIHEIRRKLK